MSLGVKIVSTLTFLGRFQKSLLPASFSPKTKQNCALQSTSKTAWLLCHSWLNFCCPLFCSTVTYTVLLQPNSQFNNHLNHINVYVLRQLNTHQVVIWLKLIKATAWKLLSRWTAIPVLLQFTILQHNELKHSIMTTPVLCKLAVLTAAKEKKVALIIFLPLCSRPSWPFPTNREASICRCIHSRKHIWKGFFFLRVKTSAYSE